MLDDEPSDEINALLAGAIVLSVVKFDKSFDRESFDCGVAVLNDFLKIRASQYIKRYEAVVYCAFDDQTQKSRVLHPVQYRHLPS